MIVTIVMIARSSQGLRGWAGDAVGLGEVRLDVLLGARGARLGEGEGADDRQEGGDGRDPAAWFEVGESAEFGGDRDDRVPGDAEAAEGGEHQGRVVAGGYEAAESAYAVGGEGEQRGEDAGDEGQPLEAARVAGDGEVAGELAGPGPGEEGGGGGGDASGEEERAGRGEGQRDQAASGGVGHRDHALSATRSPSRPCGLTRRTMMSRQKAQTSFQEPPPKRCMPGMSSM